MINHNVFFYQNMFFIFEDNSIYLQTLMDSKKISKATIKKLKWILSLFWLIAGLFLSGNVSAQQADLSSPQATLYTHLENLKPENYHPEISAQTIYGLHGKQALDKAVKLKYIYQGKGLVIDYKNVPSDPDYIDSVYFKIPRHAYKPFPLRLPQVYVEKYGNRWYYSKETVAAVDALFASIYPYGIDFTHKYIPPVLHNTFLGLEWWQWIGLLLLLLVAYVLHILFKKLFYRILRFLKNRLTSDSFRLAELIDKRLDQFSNPLSYLVSVVFIEKLLPSLLLPVSVSAFIISGLKVAVIVFWIWVFIRLVDVFISFYRKYAEQTESKLDDQLTPILRNTLKAIILVFGAFKLLIVFGADPKTVLAGVSIGGLAIGLASQDTIKNLIGTFIIFLDKPFRIGDWIAFEGVEGSVEEVGFRSSNIRAADTTVYKVPNSKLAEIVVNNMGQRVYRRYQTKLGIRYDTPPELIEAFVEGIKKLIEIHPMTRNSSDHTPYNVRPYNVEFIEYGDFSLNILLNVYFKTQDWGEEMHARHTLLLGILELANKLGVQFAFPSQTLFMELFPGKEPAYPSYPDNPAEVQKRIAEALKEFQQNIRNY